MSSRAKKKLQTVFRNHSTILEAASRHKYFGDGHRNQQISNSSGTYGLLVLVSVCLLKEDEIAKPVPSSVYICRITDCKKKIIINK